MDVRRLLFSEYDWRKKKYLPGKAANKEQSSNNSGFNN